MTQLPPTPNQNQVKNFFSAYKRLPKATLAAMMTALIMVYVSLGWSIPGYQTQAAFNAQVAKLTEVTAALTMANAKVDGLTSTVDDLRKQLNAATQPSTKPAGPYVLDWPNRNPLRGIRIGSYAAKNEANPNGHVLWNGPAWVPVDVRTPTGAAKFNLDLLIYMTNFADLCKERGDQGAVLWDIEGQLTTYFDPAEVIRDASGQIIFDGWMGLNYFGHQTELGRVIPYLRSDAVENISKIFRDRNLVFGIGLRANGLKPSMLSGYGVTLDSKMDYKQLESEIAYGYARGVRVFYIDSNDAIDGPQIAAIAAKYPDVLLIPENTSRRPSASWDDPTLTPADEASLDAFLRATAIYSKPRMTGPEAMVPPNIPDRFLKKYPNAFRIFIPNTEWEAAHPGAIRPGKDLKWSE